jgi:NADH-quinone oxidoreductase subunit M
VSGLPVLSLLVWLPIAGALGALALKPGRAVRLWGVAVSLVALGVVALAWLGYEPARGLMYVERLRWVPSLGLEYHLGLDGLSLPLVALNALLGAVALACSGHLGGRRGYVGLLLLTQGAVAGALLALDLALYFVFWELMLLPVVLLVGMYGGADGARAGRETPDGLLQPASSAERATLPGLVAPQPPRRAALKFFLYTTAGSLLMLLAIVALPSLARHGGAPLDVVSLAGSEIGRGAQAWLFLGFAAAFAVKMPLFPLHTWLPALYEAAPLPALVYTTMLVKVGAYGFLRIALPVLPDASARFGPLLAGLSIAGIIYGGALAATAPNLVRTLAYSSIAHLGFIGLGIWSLTPQGAQGAVLQMVNHGVTAGALFVLASLLLRRTGTLEYRGLGGLAGRLPALGWLTLLATLSALGLPGLNNFVGEFLVLLGAYRAQPLYAVALVGVLLAAVYGVRLYRLSYHGPERATPVGRDDIRRSELWPLLPLLALIVLLGLYPRPVLDVSERAARAAVERPAAGVERGAAWSR